MQSVYNYEILFTFYPIYLYYLLISFIYFKQTCLFTDLLLHCISRNFNEINILLYSDLHLLCLLKQNINKLLRFKPLNIVFKTTILIQVPERLLVPVHKKF